MSRTTTTAKPNKNGKAINLDPVVVAAMLAASGRLYREDDALTTSKSESFFGGRRTAETSAGLRSYAADNENPAITIRTLSTTVTKVTVEVFTGSGQNIPLPDSIAQADSALMAALADMLSDSEDGSEDTSVLSPASPDPPEHPFSLDDLRTLPRINTIDLLFRPTLAGAPASSIQRTATALPATGTSTATAGPSSGATANHGQTQLDARTKVVRGRCLRRFSDTSDIILRPRAIAEYRADMRGPLGPRPRNIEDLTDGASDSAAFDALEDFDVAGDAMQL